ncbi:hypothetical protein BCR35DRAFT_311528 [Leucosporidium creatinivorum]|uniref:Uncharacterized protein n=1 Tax=Leucosporidium creatinivorum TaxID=106004 RepID=A0A1Y2BTN1_9BASI|nr:hypothetical protein BCR35DRAFT_311528 [Leucosporidium creatinivorum]
MAAFDNYRHTSFPTSPCSAPKLPAAPRQLFAPPPPSSAANLTQGALERATTSFFDSQPLELAPGGLPWWDCKDVPIKQREQSPLDVMHIEITPYGSATSVNSLGLQAVAIPDWTRTRAPSLASSADDDDEEMLLLPGAFEPSFPVVERSMTPTYSALGLQFDEDFEQSEELSPFAGSFSSPLLHPTPLPAPPPSPVALVLEQLSLLPRKRPAATALPTPPLSQGEAEPSGWEPAKLPLTFGTPLKSQRRPSIPLPSLPTTPISAPSTLPPPTLSRFTSALQSAIELPISSRVELTPPPPSPPTPLLPTTYTLYGETLHFVGLASLHGHLPPTSDPTSPFLRQQRCVAECEFDPSSNGSSSRGGEAVTLARVREHFIKCPLRKEAFEGVEEVDALAILCLEQMRVIRTFRLQEDAQHDSMGLGLSSPKPTPAFIPIPTPPTKRRRRV